MCGFTGFIGHPAPEAELCHAAASMAAAIRHRGPDSNGTWADETTGFAVAHCRLAIIDVSPAGHQPMISASGRYVIAFNGEIYNFAEIRRDLESAGKAPAWRGTSDTEVLLAAIDAWGVRRTLQMSAGMFAFALYDKSSRTLTLARDRIGEKPLYYGWQNGAFLFGSDLAALRRHPSWQGEIDREALAEFLRLAYVPAPMSIYEGVYKLAPGTFIDVRAGDVTMRTETYWSAFDTFEASSSDPFRGSPEEAVTEAGKLLSDAVRGQMISDVPLGAFLSGGIDSSLVAATMQKLSPRPIKTFTIGFEDPQYDEAAHAARVAGHLRTEHTQLYVTAQQALDLVPKLSDIYSEPFADASQIPAHLLCKLARGSVTVALTGDGGDEVFSGYDRYRFADRVWPALARTPSILRRPAARAIGGPAASVLDTVGRSKLGERARKLSTVLAAPTCDDAYQSLTTHWASPRDTVIGASRPTPSGGYGISCRDPVRRMMLADLDSYLPGDVLAKVDRASMAVSLETRVPLIDHRLVEFTFRLPTKILRKNSQSKWISRELLAQDLPRDLFTRPKMGFSVPLASWLCGPLKPWAEALIETDRLSSEGYFAPDGIRSAWDDHQSGRSNNAHKLWPVLMFQAWLESGKGKPE